MSNTNFPETSMEAYKALTPEKLSADWKKIIEALKVLGVATYEEISDYIQCREPNVVSRRLAEMERMELIWKPGFKKLTKRHRNAFVYQLTNGSQPKTDKENHFKKGEKSISDFSRKITELTGSATVQQQLF